jgi:hypothetical protein
LHNDLNHRVLQNLIVDETLTVPNNLIFIRFISKG